MSGKGPRGGERALRLLVIALGVGSALASDPPDSRVNAISGNVEVPDSAVLDGDYNVRHVINPGGGQALQVTQLTSNSADDLSPRIAIDSSGNTRITWFRSLTPSQVLSRRRTNSSGSWASEQLVSDAGEDSKNPETVFAGSKPWVVFEITVGSSHSIAVNRGVDEPNPFPGRTILGTAAFSGPVDSTISYESGKLWASWVDSASNVAWCQWNATTAAWTSPNYESYSADSVAAARARIRTAVLVN